MMHKEAAAVWSSPEGQVFRKWLLWAVIVAAATLLQATWLDNIRFRGVLPDLPVALVVYYALAEGEERAMFTGVLAGMFQDVATDVTLGHHILVLVLIGYTVGRLNKRLVTDHPALKAGLVFVAAVMQGFLATVILYFHEPETHALHMIFALEIPGAFYTAIITPLVFLFLDWATGRLRQRGGGVAA